MALVFSCLSMSFALASLALWLARKALSARISFLAPFLSCKIIKLIQGT